MIETAIISRTNLADNNPIPPRSRARCCADSPRRGEYGALATRLRRLDINSKFKIDVKMEILFIQVSAI